jgi:hypothetical protein
MMALTPLSMTAMTPSSGHFSQAVRVIRARATCSSLRKVHLFWLPPPNQWLTSHPPTTEMKPPKEKIQKKTGGSDLQLLICALTRAATILLRIRLRRRGAAALRQTLLLVSRGRQLGQQVGFVVMKQVGFVVMSVDSCFLTTNRRERSSGARRIQSLIVSSLIVLSLIISSLMVLSQRRLPGPDLPAHQSQTLVLKTRACLWEAPPSLVRDQSHFCSKAGLSMTRSLGACTISALWHFLKHAKI